MDCIFCKIAKGEIDSAKIWENGEFVAILDVFPNTKGMTLVMPKEHFDSNIFSMSQEMYAKFTSAAREVVRLLEKKLGVQRVAMVAEGMGVNHAHIKLYPMHGLEKEFKEMWAKEKVFFKTYPGYITTQLGEKADMNELKKLAEEIKLK